TLIQKVKEAAAAPSGSLVLPESSTGKQTSAPASAEHVDIVVLGVSTGGPQALRYLLPQFPADLPVPLVMVLHIPVGYTTLLAQKLAESSKLPVKEAYEGCPVVPRQALLAPAGQHLSFKRSPSGQVIVTLSST